MFPLEQSRQEIVHCYGVKCYGEFAHKPAFFFRLRVLTINLRISGWDLKNTDVLMFGLDMKYVKP